MTMVFYSYVLGNIAWSLFDDGLANLLGLETLRHGTNPFNNLRIRIKGGDPNHGGKASGSTKGWSADDTKNYFYVFKDNEFFIESEQNRSFLKTCIEYLFRIKGIGARILSRQHVAYSGYNFAAQLFWEEDKSLAIRCINVFSGVCSFLISPTLRFRFSKLDSARFENDPIYAGMAYRTQKMVEPWRIGLLGSILTGVNLEWFSRIKANPLKILTGILQIICAVAITILCINVLISNPFLAIPAAISALTA